MGHQSRPYVPEGVEGLKELVHGKMKTLKGCEPKTIEERIQRLEDIEAIKEVMHQYARYADIRNPEGMIACFSDDSTAIFTFKDEDGTLKEHVFNKQETYEFYKKAFAGNVESSSHYICNEQFFFETMDVAVGYLYMYTWTRFKAYPDIEDVHRWGRYELRYVREDDGEWRIKNYCLYTAGEFKGDRIAEQFNRTWPPEWPNEKRTNA